MLAVSADIRDAAAVKAAADSREGGVRHDSYRRQQRRRSNQAAGSADQRPEADWVDDLNLKTVGMLRVTQAFFFLPLMPRD